jgi:CDP-4-dehydro-6-deoxyglucose reductase, E3
MSVQILTEPGKRRFEAEPEETVLAAALRQGVGLPYGCRNGSCGACAAELLSGSVDYPSGNTEALAERPAGTCLTCQAVPQSDLTIAVAEIESVVEIPVRTLPARVERMDRLSHDVVRLFLKLPEQQRLQFYAGQYLDILLGDGRRRAFSIANAPHDDGLIELHVRQVPGGELSAHLFEHIKEKSILRVQAPLGTFFLRESSPRPIVLMCGGTGFAPIKSMIEHAFHVGIERPMHLYWGVRSRRDLYLPDLPTQWTERHPQLVYTPVLSEPDADWAGRTGFVHRAVVEDHPSLKDFDVYMSGPPVMVEAGRVAFEALGLPREHMFSDAFEYAADTRAKRGEG